MKDTEQAAAPTDERERQSFAELRHTLSTQQLVRLTTERRFWDLYICAVVDDIVLGRTRG
jgi:hypothetical protein